MNRKEENSDSIPIDLIINILSRLPAKSTVRFRCVSNLWGSILGGPYFTELFLTRSHARPRILFALRNSKREWSLFSSLQLQNPYQKSSLVVAADFHINLPRDRKSGVFSIGYASGLIYFSGLMSEEKDDAVHVISNPCTGQYAILPKLIRLNIKSYSFLGFDPIGKQYKVLSMSYPDSGGHKILTLGTGFMMWRKIKCPLIHEPWYEGICINGVLYYLAKQVNDMSLVIVRFDVRSEKFKFIQAQSFNYWSKLVNYKGKLGVISCEKYGPYAIKLRMWVLEDVENQQLSKYVYTMSENKIIDLRKFSIVGVTTKGEIVLSMKSTSRQPFYVFYFNPERNTLQRVEIQGLDENCSRVYAFVNHVEDLNVTGAIDLESSQGLNIIRERLKPQQRDSAPYVKRKRSRQSS